MRRHRPLGRKLINLFIAIALLAVLPGEIGCSLLKEEKRPPEAAFTAEPTSGTIPLTIQFTDHSTGEIAEWAWDFNNDGEVDSIERGPSYTYTTLGKYTVSLKVSGPAGSDIETRIGYINTDNPLQISLLDVALRTIPFLRVNLNNFYSLKNPVLERGALGEWDQSYCYGPSLVRVGNNWRIYYSGSNGGAGSAWGIGYAEGADIYNLTKYTGNPIITQTETWEALTIEHPYVIRLDDTHWIMYYTCLGADNRKRIAYAESADGVTWTNKQIVVDTPPSAWGEGHMDCSILFFDRQEGTQYLFFDAVSPSYRELVPLDPYTDFGSCIGLATATDWKTFTKQKIVLKTPKGPITDGTMFPGGIARLGSFYVMTVGAMLDERWSAFIAVSQDLMNWHLLPKQYFSVNPDSSDLVSRELHYIYIYEGKVYITTTEHGWGLGGQIGIIEIELDEPFTTVLVDKASLGAGTTTALTDCLLLQLDDIDSLNITVECTYNASANAGGKLYLYTSADGINYDTEPVETARTLAFTAGATKRESFTPSDAAQRARFLKCIIENLDGTYAISNIKVTATIGVTSP